MVRALQSLLIFVAASSAGAAHAAAPAPDPPFSVALRDTVDVWLVPQGSDPGTAILNKLQIAAFLSGDHFGLPGWKAHAQLFRFDGQSLSQNLGDIQTADNLEAPPVTRLFEAWISRQWGRDNRSLTLRAGLIDLNSQFDSVDPASLMINSSHGIGPDLSRSGQNGPSIYPVSALGTTLTAVPSDRWTFRLGLFGGVPGDPDRPRALVAERLGRHDGLLTIGQVDRQLGKSSRIEAGLWRYSARADGIDGGRPHDAGAYVSLEAPLPGPPRVTGWVRAGFADGRAQAVGGYLGLGAVQSGTFAKRPDDRLGIAIAHAVVSDQGVAVLDVHHAETSLELSYQLKLGEQVAVQPDLEFIHHPAGVSHAPDSVGFGLRLAFTAGYPKKPAATDPADPTVPPDGAPTTAPNDAPGSPTPGTTPSGGSPSQPPPSSSGSADSGRAAPPEQRDMLVSI
jgi:porin